LNGAAQVIFDVFGHDINLSQSDIVESLDDSVHVDPAEGETSRLDAHPDAVDG
jgi:hypothetical protein